MFNALPAAIGTHPPPWRLSLPNDSQAVVLDAQGLIVVTTGNIDLATRIVHLANLDALVAEMASLLLRVAQSKMPGQEADAMRRVASLHAEAIHALACRHQEGHDPEPLPGVLAPEQMARGELRTLVTRLTQARAQLEAVTGEGQQWLDGAVALGQRRLDEGENRALPLQGIGVAFPSLSREAITLVRRFAYAIAPGVESLLCEEDPEDVQTRIWQAFHQGDMRTVAACAAILWDRDQHPTPVDQPRPGPLPAGREAEPVHL